MSISCLHGRIQKWVELDDGLTWCPQCLFNERARLEARVRELEGDRLSPEATREILEEIKNGSPGTPERIATFRRVEEMRTRGVFDSDETKALKARIAALEAALREAAAMLLRVQNGGISRAQREDAKAARDAALVVLNKEDK